MSPRKALASLLLIAGALALVYGGFTYTKDRHAVELGPVSLTVQEKERVNVPVWAGLAAVIAGGIGLALPGRRG